MSLATSRDVTDEDISKAQVTIPPPGGTTRFALLGQSVSNDIVNYNRRQQYAIYYEMYRQHPVVRAAIDKKSAICISGGWHYVPSNSEEDVVAYKQSALERFLRNSSGKQLLRITYKDMFIYGEAFWFVQRSSAKTRTPMKALRLNPRFMSPKIKDGVLVSWIYGPVQRGDTKQEYEESEILHFKIDDPEDDVQGLSPLHSIQRAVTQDIYAMEYNQNFFANSAQTGTIFIVKTSTEAEMERNREWLESNYVGPENAHRPLLLEGDVTVAHSVSSAHDMEFLNGREFNREEILMVLEVDPDKLGLHRNSNRSVSKTLDDSFASEVIWPIQAVVEEELNNKLIDGIYGWNDILFQHRERDPRRAGEQADLWDKHQKSGRMSPNDGRKAMGLKPVKGGDIYGIQTAAGFVPLPMIEQIAQLQIDKVSSKKAPQIPASTGQQVVVPEPISGVNTTSTGRQNPPQAMTPKELRAL